MIPNNNTISDKRMSLKKKAPIDIFINRHKLHVHYLYNNDKHYIPQLQKLSLNIVRRVNVN